MTWSPDAILSLDVMFAECQGDTEWLVWALIRLLAVSTTRQMLLHPGVQRYVL